jgi:hypothetical protein
LSSGIAGISVFSEASCGGTESPEMIRLIRSLLLYCCLLTAAGCAQFAVRPSTPAKDIPPSAFAEPRPGERFFITLFGSQSTARIPRRTHSWGTVLHVIEQGKGRPPLVEAHTISWLPATLEIRPSLRVVPGVNLSLQETLRYVLAQGEHVSQWGPYECKANLYYRFLVQKDFLESGRVGYQLVDTVGEAARRGNGCDCIHAMTDMDPEFSRDRYPLIRYGNSATRFVVRECRQRDVLINPDQTHAWLNAYLNLDSYPVRHR